MADLAIHSVKRPRGSAGKSSDIRALTGEIRDIRD
jgi:hypothetical protein